ncbi:hypothetical protein J4E82_004361 [Alternaria postmessia]|uniref:uncharacterized protein n=1 Tax=Alternaria postmessia TaxID=1187938 RepID=UPI002224019D|nr:uncharacterized protein J4E82_004361 [Alternaria postmessia]KAI5376986.1 hypothetical protein J4E82_004361 [Alternaria postmessia]
MGAWGYCLFQSDHDFDMVSDLSHEAGLTKLGKDARVSAKAAGKSDEDIERDIFYSIYANLCSDPELVRRHLDSGILVDMIAKKETKMLTPRTTGLKEKLFGDWSTDPCYEYILLGACAMTLGCQLPATYLAMLKKVYTEGGVMPDGQRQMKKALFGPGGYKNGEPYDFKSKTILEEANSKPAKEPEDNGRGFMLMNVPGPGGFFNTGMTTTSTSLVIKELRSQLNKPNECGGCGVASRPKGEALLACGKCKNRKYCSTSCQKKHWKIHEKVCESAKVSL